jgi:multiple sugar transport system substrate-binding protein
MRTSVTGILAGISLALACGTSVHAQDKQITIFWAEWDPANYLQELGNEYEKETGVKVVVETTPWSDFQTKAFTEFNAKGSAYDLVVGDSQWLGAASEGGHYVELTDFVKENNILEKMAPATVKYYSEYPGNSGNIGRSRPRATPSAGPTARTGSRTPRRWRPSRRSTATTSPRRRPSRN